MLSALSQCHPDLDPDLRSGAEAQHQGGHQHMDTKSMADGGRRSLRRNFCDQGASEAAAAPRRTAALTHFNTHSYPSL